MAKGNKKLKQKRKPISFAVIDNVFEKVHIKKLLLFVSLTGATFILIFSLLGYAENKPFLIFENIFNTPKVFAVSTILLLTINFFILKMVSAVETESFVKLKKYSLIGLVLMFAFGVAQAIGVWQLLEQKIHFVSFYSRVYIYTIFGMHTLGMVFGTITLIHYFLLSIKLVKDPVKRLVMTTNSYQKVKTEMLSIFWNYFTFSWVLLFLYFYFTIS